MTKKKEHFDAIALVEKERMNEPIKANCPGLHFAIRHVKAAAPATEPITR